MKPLSKLHTEAIEKARTEQAKVKAAALAMIETPMNLIKAVLLKHEEAVIDVMRELHQQQQEDEGLLRQALEALEMAQRDAQIAEASTAIAKLKERLK
jgi:acetoin utilization deacetylase AcuC-like enzyme